MTKEMKFAKCLAVLRKIYRMGKITESQYQTAKGRLMERYFTAEGDFKHAV